MYVELRMYKRHDADLIMLKGQGVSIHKLLLAALDNYVQGVRIKYRIPKPESMDPNHVQTIRYHVNVRNPEAEKLLKSIRRGYRNQFCKMLLRDALEAEPMAIFMAKNMHVENETQRLETSSMISPLRTTDFKMGGRKQRTVAESMPQIMPKQDAPQDAPVNTEEPKPGKEEAMVQSAEEVKEPKTKPVEPKEDPKKTEVQPEQVQEAADEWDLFGDFEEEEEQTFADNDSILSGFEQLMQ